MSHDAESGLQQKLSIHIFWKKTSKTTVSNIYGTKNEKKHEKLFILTYNKKGIDWCMWIVINVKKIC